MFKQKIGQGDTEVADSFNFLTLASKYLALAEIRKFQIFSKL